MEDINPWLDPNASKHKNKKSKKPIRVEVHKDDGYYKKSNKQNTSNNSSSNNKNITDEFIKTLIEDSLTGLNQNSVKWANETFDEEWVKEFTTDIKILKQDFLTGYYPSETNMLLLKYIFLLQRGLEV